MCWYRLSTRLLETMESPVAKNGHEAADEVAFGRRSELRRSTRSSEKSISSTVQVF